MSWREFISMKPGETKEQYFMRQLQHNANLVQNQLAQQRKAKKEATNPNFVALPKPYRGQVNQAAAEEKKAEDVEHPGRQAVEEKKSIAAYSKVLQREKEVAALAHQLLQLPEKRLKELIEKIKKEIEEGEEVVYPGYAPSKGGKHKKRSVKRRHTKRKYTKKRKTYKK